MTADIELRMIKEKKMKEAMKEEKCGLEEIKKISEVMHVDDDSDLMSTGMNGEYIDDVKGGTLEASGVLEARAEEMSYVPKHKLYTKVPREWCRQATGKEPIKTGWVDTNKGSAQVPNYRSRWVATEYKRYNDTELFAATPPLEALRLLLSGGASSGRTDTCFAVVDVRRAYFYAPARRDLYVELPWEDWEAGDEGKCGLLRGSLYGTRDAARNWDEDISRAMKAAGFVKGTTSTCIYYNIERDVTGMIHGDDIVLEGRRKDVEAVTSFLETQYEVRKSMVGMHSGLSKELKILNRTVGINSRG